jgi:catechol 2,3-dioxygenase-like lactoylglutathione lyase family enzyme
MRSYVAGLLTGLAVSVAVAQSGGTGVSMMNHVGINVPNIPDAIKYYTEKLGYREAFRVTGENGQPTLVYMYISRNTFLELQQAGPGPDRPAGFTHYGLVVDKAEAAVANFKSRGATVTNVNTSAGTKAKLANITDPYMGRVELVEITPDSMHAKALAAAR